MDAQWQREMDRIAEELSLMSSNEVIDLLLRALRKIAIVLKQNPELIFHGLQ